MISILFALIPFGCFFWMVRMQKAALIAASFLIFSLLTRTAALVYVDLAGPFYSDQLETVIGGGESMPLFAGSVLAFLCPLAFCFRRSAIAKKLNVHQRQGSFYDPGVFLNKMLVVSIFVVAAVYLDMLVRGPIPLLIGMDRLVYNQEVAGPLHNLLNQNGFLFAFLLGLIFVYPRAHGSDFKIGALVLFVIIQLYFALTGNRFAAFYAFTSFFVIPLAMLPLLSSVGLLGQPPRTRTVITKFVLSRSAQYLGVFLGAFFLVTLLLHSVVNVRAYDDPEGLFFQRILIQPIEIWWASWADIQNFSGASFDFAWREMFVDPIDATRNTSVRMLMIKHLGYHRALELAEYGTQFAGGYPEVFIELLGPWFMLPVALMFGVVTALLLRVALVSATLGRIGSAVLAIYVFYGFAMLYIGGMLNFLIAWTFWVKCFALLAVYLVERKYICSMPTSEFPHTETSLLTNPLYDSKLHD